MELLSPKKEAFCQAFVSGKTGADSYRLSFDAENMANGTIWNKASELLNDDEVRGRIEFLRRQLEKKCLWSLEDSVNTLKSVIEAPDKTADVVSAVKELNSMYGYKAAVKQEVDVTVKEPKKIKFIRATGNNG